MLILVCFGVLIVKNTSYFLQIEKDDGFFNPQSSDFYLTKTELVSWNSTGDSFDPSIALDSEGNTHIVWADRTDYLGEGNTNLDLFYVNRSISTGLWSDIEVITSNLPLQTLDADLIADNLGNLHLAFTYQSSPNDVYYMSYSGGIWSSAEIISTESTGFAKYPEIAIDSNQNVHIVWQDNSNYNGAGTDEDVFYKNRTAGGIWSITEVVSAGSSSVGNSLQPDIDCDQWGNPHIVWYEYDDISGTSGTDADIYYKNMTALTGNWGSAVLISEGSTDSSMNPSIVVDRSSPVIHIAWYDKFDITGSSGATDYDIFYCNYTVSTNTWSSIEDATWDSNVYAKSDPILQLNGNVLHLVYEEDQHVSYKNRTLSAPNWGLIQQISDTTGSLTNPNPRFIVTSAGMIQFAWGHNSQYNNSGFDRDIFFKEINLLPDLTSPADQNNLVTSSGNIITWVATDAYSVCSPNYTVVWNITNGVTTGYWTSGEDIIVNIDDYSTSLGEYIFTIIIDDGHGVMINDSVLVTVYNMPPVLTTPEDVVYKEGTRMNNITWGITDSSAFIGDYIVYQNGTMVTPGTWTNGDDIIINVDELEPGNYNYTIIVSDGFGGYATDEVLVTVISTALFDQFPFLDEILYISGGVIVTAAILGVILTIIKKKKLS